MADFTTDPFTQVYDAMLSALAANAGIAII